MHSRLTACGTRSCTQVMRLVLLAHSLADTLTSSTQDARGRRAEKLIRQQSLVEMWKKDTLRDLHVCRWGNKEAECMEFAYVQVRKPSPHCMMLSCLHLWVCG